MTRTKNLIALALLTLGSVAHAQDATTSYGIPLAPGEMIIDVYNAPPVVQVPAAPSYATVPYIDAGARANTSQPIEIDRVTGLPRNQSGWSGDTGRPAGIGCFPQGVCTHLN